MAGAAIVRSSAWEIVPLTVSGDNVRFILEMQRNREDFVRFGGLSRSHTDFPRGSAGAETTVSGAASKNRQSGGPDASEEPVSGVWVSYVDVDFGDYVLATPWYAPPSGKHREVDEVLAHTATTPVAETTGGVPTHVEVRRVYQFSGSVLDGDCWLVKYPKGALEGWSVFSREAFAAMFKRAS